MSLTVKLTKSGAIIIRLPKSTLARATRLNPENWVEDKRTGRMLLPKIWKTDELAREIHQILSDDFDDPDNLVSEMFDKAIQQAIEAGSCNVIFGDDEDYGRKVFADE